MSLRTELDKPTREEEMARLVRAIRLASGFRLYFALSAPGKERRGLFEEVSAALGNLVRVFDVERGVDSLRSALELELSRSDAPKTVFVTGIEKWVPAGNAGAGSAFVRNLNASRDRFAETVPCSMVIWGADHVLLAIQHGAPDFFSVASGSYLFPEIASDPSKAPGLETPTLEGTAHWLREREEVEERLAVIGEEPAGTAVVDRITR
jgi:hypothetical protein